MSFQTALADYRKMAKPRDVEEVGDVYLIRPAGFLIVQLVRRTPVTPTMLSVLAVLAGWWSAYLYYGSNRLGNVASLSFVACLVFLLHSALDSADGQLARLTERHTPLGRLVDGFCDNLVFLAIYVAIVVGHWERVGDYQLVVAALAVVAGISHSIQSSLTDYQRALYMKYVFRRKDVEEYDPEHVERAVRATGGVFMRLLHVLHLGYYGQQRLFLASTFRLRDAVAAQMRERPLLAAELPAIYARHQRGMMKYWALLAPNSHKMGIIGGSFLPVAAGSFWASLGMAWYFIYDLLLNVVMVALIYAQAKVNASILRELRGRV